MRSFLRQLRPLAGLVALAFVVAAEAAVNLIPSNATWRYLDTGVPPAADWLTVGYADGGWGSGPAQLGYGDNDEATVVGYGPDANNKYLTTWFRHTFTVNDPGVFGSLTLQVLRDDGCVVYLNGQEVARYNLPTGPITPTTLASVGSEYSWDPALTLQNLLVAGDNVVAVEVHQSAGTSTDLSFALQLDGEAPVPEVTLVQPVDGGIAHGSQVDCVVDASDPGGLSSATLWLGQPPRTLTFTGPGRTVDTYLSADAPGVNYSTGTSATIDGKSPHAHSLIQFLDLIGLRADQVPSGVTITSARLRVYCSNSSVNLLKVYGLNEDWDPAQATWNQCRAGVPWSNTGADGNLSHGTTSASGDCTTTGWRTFDVTALVQEWCGGKANHGLILVDSGSDGIAIATTESATPPELVVEYGGSALVPVATQALSGTSARITFTLPLMDLQEYVWNCEVLNCAGLGSRADVDGRFTVDLHYPKVVEVIAPAQGGTPQLPEVNLTVRVEDPDPGSQMTVTFYGRGSQADGEPFTIAVLPDTQKYVASSSYAPILTKQTQWIVDQKVTWNIPFVSQVGDVADTYTSAAQYDLANASLSVLDQAGVPYGLLPGNHDQPTTLFNQYFPYGRYAANAWYGGHHPVDKNDNSLQLFTAGGMDFLALHLAFWPDAATVQWADTVLKSYPNRIALISTHGYLNVDATRNVHVMGSTEYLWEQLVVPNPNVSFVFCGHVAGEARRSDSVNGRVVHQMLADYQSLPEGGQGWMRLLRFVPAEDRVYVKTWSPHLNRFQTDADSEFTLDFPMSGFAVLGQVTGVGSGQSATLAWPGLAEGEVYEWYATVADATGRSTRGPWSYFTPSTVPDTTRPVISDLQVADINETSARLTWTTDEPATSGVKYWIDLAGGHVVVSDPDLVTVHELILSNLSPGTPYQGEVQSTDAAGNSAVPRSFEFTTLRENHPPTCAGAEMSLSEDGSVVFTLVGTDPEGDPLTFQVVVVPQQGTLSGTAPNLTYTPVPDYHGDDSFTYTVSDGRVSSAAATVVFHVVAVNDTPVAQPAALSTPEDTPLSSVFVGTDADGDSVAYTVTQPPAHGDLVVTGASWTYTPHAEFQGVDSFLFRAIDAESSSAPAAVTITVVAVNDPPVVDAGSDQTVQQNTTVILDASGSSDPDGPALTHAWQQLAGPVVVLSDTASAQPSFAAPMVELDTTLVFSVTVSDGSLAVSDTVSVTVENGTFDAVVRAEPSGTNTVVSGAISDMRWLDGTMHRIAETEVNGDFTMDAVYSLQCLSPVGQVVGFTLRLNATYSDTVERMRVWVLAAGGWEEITGRLSPGGEFTPATPADYVLNGMVSVRLADVPGLSPDLTCDVLEVDRLVAHIQAYPPDTQAPATPNGLVASVLGPQVTLTWTENAEPDVAGYRVYRAGPGTDPFTDVSGLIPGVGWVDNVSVDGTYEYCIAAEDRLGNQSERSSAVQVQVRQQATHVAAISLAIQKVSKKYQATAAVTIQDQRNVVATGATVVGDWYFKGALLQSGAMAVTGTDGVARFTSPQVAARVGNVFLFRVAGVTKPGYAYDPTMNVVTERSIAVH